MADTDECSNRAERRGLLKVYLGATPGCGKTFAMLREGHDRRDQGEDVVVGLIESHGRPRTADAVGTLEVVPRITVDYRGTQLADMDLNAVLHRRPHVALVDELAHTNAPGLQHAKRWEDIDDLRDAGIDVITTMNIQHLESVKDLVEQIAGIAVQETVPDTVLESADEIQFIDITPEALRKRMQHGNVYPRDRVATALHNFFRPGNLAALREIGLRYVAGRVASERVGIISPPENVLVAVSGRRSAEPLIRRAVRIARRERGLCIAFHVHEQCSATSDDAWRRLAGLLNCTVIERDGGDIPDALIKAVRESGARHVVLGDPKLGGRLPALRPTVLDCVMRDLPDVDVHIIAHETHGAVNAAAGTRPDADELLHAVSASPAGYGALRIYLGYVRGCGATTAMLDEARRRVERGTDVIVAAVSGSPPDLGGLQYLGGPRSAAARGLLDVGGLLRRNPEVAIVDDLAGPTDDGGTVADAVPRLRQAGITLIATADLTHMRTVVGVMGDRLGPRSDEPLLDDAVFDEAEEIELVDVVPAQLIERLRLGEIMPLAHAAQALQTAFRPDVLAALREIAFRYVAHHTDRRLVRYMSSARITSPWEARPRVLVCILPRPGEEILIRRAAALAASRDEDLTALSVRGDQLSEAMKEVLGTYAALTHQLGGEFISVYGSNIAEAIARYAQGNRITEILMMRGPRPRHRSRTLVHLIRRLSDVNVHVLAQAV